MKVLAYLALIGFALAGIVWVAQVLKDRLTRPLPAAPLPASLTDGRLEERASLAYGAERGSGMLRLTPSQVVFTSDSDRTVVIERLDIVGVGVTHELPDHHVAHEVLVITTALDVYYFAVASPSNWVRRLTHPD